MWINVIESGMNNSFCRSRRTKMLNVNLLSGHAHCGTFPLVPGRLVKCLSGAIKFEYRIRPD